MSHLSPERLAALIDEQPTAGELAHLASCRPCSRERGAYEALAAMAHGGLSIGQPLTTWDKLSPVLRQDGVIEPASGASRRARFGRRWLQVAAALLLVAGGAALGRLTTPAPDAVDVAAEPKFTSVEEAQAAAARAQNVYQASLAYLAGQDPSRRAVETPAAIKTRLAALEQVTRIAGAALEDAPYDPVVNTLYLNARGQRDASMRMLNTASTRLTTY